MRKNQSNTRTGMRLPAKGSRAVIVLDQLYQAPCPVGDIAKRHAEFGLSFSALEAIFEGLIAIGCAELSIDVYSITIMARRHFDRASMPATTAGAAAGPAYRPEPRPLRKPAVKMAEMREGATDYLAIPSRIGDRRYQHGESK